MPELAEVEFYRKRWDAGLGEPVTSVRLHGAKRIFRGVSAQELATALQGAVLQRSEARGKQMLFQFSKGLFLGLHLGMTGKLSAAAPEFVPGKHDHLVLYQTNRALVFSDPRLFGRVRFDQGTLPPEWWSQLPPSIHSKAFTKRAMAAFLRRHSKLPIKAALLLQRGFPGIGNWMADEILWRAKIDPRTPGAGLSAGQLGNLWRRVRWVGRGAMLHVGTDFSDPPAGWLFHERWKRAGICPLHKGKLRRATIGGRTTVWCEACQPASGHPSAPSRSTIRSTKSPPG